MILVRLSHVEHWHHYGCGRLRRDEAVEHVNDGNAVFERRAARRQECRRRFRRLHSQRWIRMTREIRQIVLTCEAAVLRAVANGSDVSDIERARDEAFDKLRELKESMRAQGQLDAFFAAAAEIMTKFDMAMKATGK